VSLSSLISVMYCSELLGCRVSLAADGGTLNVGDAAKINGHSTESVSYHFPSIATF
jgi:hypothetical protein